MDQHQQLWDSTGRAHSTIQMATFDLQDIAARVDYLHPKLADELMELAKTIEHARKTIQGNASEIVNLDIKRGEQHMGELLVTLLDRCSS